MTTNGIVGAVAGLWRFPVKSMRGERLEQAELTEHGLVGDRAYALIDADTGKLVSAKSVRLFPDLFGCRAAFVEPPQSGGELPPVQITLPDGTLVTSDSSDADRVLSTYFRRDVTLARAAPDEFTIDQYHPDIEDVDPAGYQPLGGCTGPRGIVTLGMLDPVRSVGKGENSIKAIVRDKYSMIAEGSY